MPRLRLVPTSLTARLVAILVALVIVATVVVGAVTTLSMRRYLGGQLDDQLQATRGGTSFFWEHGGQLPAFPDRDGDGDERGGPQALDRGTVTMVVIDGERTGDLLDSTETVALSARRRACWPRSRGTASLTTWTCPDSATTGWSPPRSPGSGVPVVTGLPTSVDDSDHRAARRLRGPRRPARRRRRGRRRDLPGAPPAPPAAPRSPTPPTRSPTLPLSTGAIGETVRVPERPHRRAHRGRPGRRGAQHDARARRARSRRPAPQRAPGPPVRRRRLPRAAHAPDHDPRVRRAQPPYDARRPGPALARDGQGRGGGDADVLPGRGPARCSRASTRAVRSPATRST